MFPLILTIILQNMGNTDLKEELDRLKHAYQDLKEEISLLSKNIENKANLSRKRGALATAGVTCEAMLKFIYRREGLEKGSRPADSLMLEDLLQKLSAVLPPWIQINLRTIQAWRNMGAHDKGDFTEIDDNTFTLVDGALNSVVLWFFQKYLGEQMASEMPAFQSKSAEAPIPSASSKEVSAVQPSTVSNAYTNTEPAPPISQISDVATNSPTTIATAVTSPDAGNSVPKIGDNFGGGIVFYVDDSGRRGLIAHTKDFECGWGRKTGPKELGTLARIGSGFKNTQLMFEAQQKIFAKLNKQPEQSAAVLCKDIDVDGFKDWYLPSIEELEQLYYNLYLEGKGNLSDDMYWSSTENNTDLAECFDMSDGMAYYNSKSSNNKIRPIRSYSI